MTFCCKRQFAVLLILIMFGAASLHAGASAPQESDTAKQYSGFSNIPKYGEDRLVHSGFTRNSSGKLQFTPADNHTPLILQLDADFSNFERLYIDGELLQSSGYTVAKDDQTFEIPCERFYEVFGKHGTRDNPLTIHHITFSFGGEIVELDFQAALPAAGSHNLLQFVLPLCAAAAVVGIILYRRVKAKKA